MTSDTQTLRRAGAETPSRLAYFYSYRYFFWSLVKKEFKVRYTQSLLGLSWMVLEPLLLVITLSTIFTMLGRKGPGGVPFPIFFYAGLLPWNIFKSAISNGAGSFVGDRGLLKKIPYPREITIFKNWIIYFVEFLFASIAFLVILAFYQHPPNWHWLYLPGLLGLVFIFSVGIMFAAASVHVYIRDVGILMKTIANVWFWFTPIILDFPFSGMTKILYYLNPMVGIVKGFRAVILFDEAPNVEWLFSISIAMFISIGIGYTIFRKLEKGFVDVL